MTWDGTVGTAAAAHLFINGVEQLTAELATRLGPPERFDRFTVGDIEVDVVENGMRLPDRPDTFIDWPAKVEVYAESTPDADVARFDLEHLHDFYFVGVRVELVRARQ